MKNNITTELRQQVELARTEHARIIARFPDACPLMITPAITDAYCAFLESGQSYPADHERGIWFPQSLRYLVTAIQVGNPLLLSRTREDLVNDQCEVPTWREQGW